MLAGQPVNVLSQSAYLEVLLPHLRQFIINMNPPSSPYHRSARASLGASATSRIPHIPSPLELPLSPSIQSVLDTANHTAYLALHMATRDYLENFNPPSGAANVAAIIITAHRTISRLGYTRPRTLRELIDRVRQERTCRGMLARYKSRYSSMSSDNEAVQAVRKEFPKLRETARDAACLMTALKRCEGVNVALPGWMDRTTDNVTKQKSIDRAVELWAGGMARVHGRGVMMEKSFHWGY
ncbi:hypothetical protein EDC01DRAFT_634187 [Geopyxis carbonaria]|nr:hypothetical protein EDC01DRAFT_634187 [Geopyxis carbonaria]